ncbi:hypothetical protein K458DRAFT_470125 [Lentithecium fluviatile CBS 122367]|uniref:Uncharacterized protein n=1 Tax=Lentithecium fluviatile CBS 122367 TaxID=1168545 RepID=A0A6G1ICW5_9PLEO|nr:hypothetical protein K458DRAFT_470125 [Lentithecium fluviatile CBS 122367]
MTPHLLTLPAEIRHRILFDALISDIEGTEPHPMNHRTLPFDRHLNSTSRYWESHNMIERHYQGKTFYGKELMSRLMLVCKQMHEEVYSILWSEFAIYRAYLTPNTKMCGWASPENTIQGQFL